MGKIWKGFKEWGKNHLKKKYLLAYHLSPPRLEVAINMASSHSWCKLLVPEGAIWSLFSSNYGNVFNLSGGFQKYWWKGLALFNITWSIPGTKATSWMAFAEFLNMIVLTIALWEKSRQAIGNLGSLGRKKLGKGNKGFLKVPVSIEESRRTHTWAELDIGSEEMWEDPKVSSLPDLQAPHKQEVKVKAKL